MKLALERGAMKRLSKRMSGYYFEVGILEDAEHLQAKDSPIVGTPDLKTYAGGPARKITSKPSGKLVSQIFVENQDRIGVNLLSQPFKRRTSDIIQFSKLFLKHVMGKPSTRRVENLIQAIVRNPILRQEYGGNKAFTADAKGFDRHLIDTAQMFKRITARVIKSRGSGV